MRGHPARLLLAILAAAAAGLGAFYLVPPPLPELTRAEFLDEVRAGHVNRIDIEDQETILGESSTRGEFRSGFDKKRDADLPDALRTLGIEVRYSKSALGI